jgi:hypothetical protein
MLLGLCQIAAGGYILTNRDDGTDQESDHSPTDPITPALDPAKGENSPDFQWVKPLFTYPQTLIFGGMGSGKTTIVRWIAEQRQNAGYRVVVVDPHAEFGSWDGLEVIGKGLDWQGISDFMESFIDDIKTRFELIASTPNPALQKTLIVCEEMTGWSEEIDPKLIAKFDNCLIGDIRKAKYAVIKLAHNDTLSTTGGKAGTKKTQENYIKLYLENKPDNSVTDGVSPKFQGTLTMPSQDPLKVKINPAWKPIRMGSQNGCERSANLGGEPLEPSQSIDLGNLEPLELNRLNLNKTLSLEGEGLEERVKRMRRDGMAQDSIIEAIWGVKKGGSKQYKDAREIVQQILKGV